MKHCKDCEPAQEIHFVAYMSVVLGMIDQPFFDLMELFFKIKTPSLISRISKNDCVAVSAIV